MRKKIKIDDTPLELKKSNIRDQEFLRLYGKTYKEYMSEPKVEFNEQQRKEYGIE